MFLQGPCHRREELYDREEELEAITKALKNNAWVAILGPRMAGKTSLAIVSANITGKKVVYVNFKGAESLRDATVRILNALGGSKLMGIKRIKLGPIEVEREIEKPSLLLEEILLGLKKSVVIFDEIQDVKQGVNKFLNVLSIVRNTKRDVEFIFTGSAIGLMDSLLNPDPKNPLYGRSPIKVEIGPWDIQTAINFIESGLSECRVEYTTKEISEVVEELGTLPGWLSFYGLRRCTGMRHREALEDAIGEGVKVARGELENLLRSRPEWARKALRAMAFGAKWSELLKLGASKSGLHNFLSVLKKLYLVSKKGNLYVIADPIYRKACLEL
ncbi:Archaeal ATPase family protein [Pyrococcus yayanosii CH1]|uniref:Archaeal ATPase family protein n=1 Tax=Pyrococcus yayanosii (strain CH1 / JCM 16557) TaxID=529709 RepID=F8AGF8_PYRYC|nr:Archaeal ATPase family protein [Pyrococcus yayanosii CH1]